MSNQNKKRNISRLEFLLLCTTKNSSKNKGKKGGGNKLFQLKAGRLITSQLEGKKKKTLLK